LQRNIRCPTLQGKLSICPDAYHAEKMPEDIPNLKLRELLNRLASSGQDTQDVEADLEFMLAIIPHT
jgi:hypothetical protein